ncbi:mitochondrial ribosomal protein S10 [Megalopta genalis]|uniref:mitochondrial ribosomal protein S10 n=1 Tax=Megalopta genalis TaxID=115081 RepID=UPI003FCFB967
MFHSKISTFLRNIANNSLYQKGHNNFLPCSLFSTELSHVDSSNIDESVPDKLYKKLEIEVRGHDPVVLESYGKFAVMAATHLNITVGRNVKPLKAIHKRYTLLKSVHVYKKHRVQYETRTYFRYLDFFRLTGSTADTFLEYIQRNLPEGVAMKATKVELQTLPESVKQASCTEE